MSEENKVCDSCGREIPNSAHRSMSDIDTYRCDECEEADAERGGESLEDLEQRLADRDALGVEPRPDNPVGEAHGKPRSGGGPPVNG